MGTAKRERQKANKAMREQEDARRRARSRTIKIVLAVVIGIIAVFVLVVVAGRFVGDDDASGSLVTSDHATVVDTQFAPA